MRLEIAGAQRTALLGVGADQLMLKMCALQDSVEASVVVQTKLLDAIERLIVQLDKSMEKGDEGLAASARLTEALDRATPPAG